MLLVNTTTRETVTDGEFYRLFATTSFPFPLTNEVVGNFGYALVADGAHPALGENQYEVMVGVEEIGSEWFSVFEARDYTAEEIEARLEAKRRNMAAISDRQFYQQAAVLGVISHTEALAAVQTGTIPSVLQNIVDAEPDANKRFAMEMLLAGATAFQRLHPMTSPVGLALGLTEAEIDQFFIDAALL